MQRIFLEGGHDDLPLAVLEVTRAFGAGDHPASQGADANGIDADVLFLERGQEGQRIAVVVFAIGDEQDDAVGGALGGEGIDGGAQRLFDGGAAAGDDAGIEIIEGHGEGGIIDGERALEDGGAGEGDQADAVAAQIAHQIADTPFGLLQTRGLDIAGGHRARGVEHDQDIEALAADVLPVESPLGAGQSQKKQHQGTQAEPQPGRGARGIPRGGQDGQHGGIDQLLQRSASAAQKGEEGPRERDGQRQPVEIMDVAPDHGSLPRRVKPSRVSSDRHSSARIRKGVKRSS